MRCMDNIFQIFKYAENMHHGMEGLENIANGGITVPGIVEINDILPLIGQDVFSDSDQNKAFEHCMKVIETMITESKNGSQRIVSMLLGRKADSYLQLPPEALREVFPVLFYEVLKDTSKTMKFLRTYVLLHNSGLVCNVSTSFEEIKTEIGCYPAAAISILKLHEYSDWFNKLPMEERKRRILEKNAVRETLADAMEPILSELEKQGKESRKIVYGHSETTK